MTTSLFVSGCSRFLIKTVIVAKKCIMPEKSMELEEVILKYWPQINFRVLRSLGYSNTDWEDVAGEIMLNIIESVKKGKFRGDSSIGTFIYTITSRRIIDYIRKKYKTPQHPPEPNNLPGPFDVFAIKERSEFVTSSLKKLKPKQADILYLHYFQDLSYVEIAQAYGQSPQWIGDNIRSARKSLEKIIRNTESDNLESLTGHNLEISTSL